jgi:hypothetical protein
VENDTFRFEGEKNETFFDNVHPTGVDDSFEYWEC